MLLDIVVLAAGKGTRMKSALPKVLHPLGGTSLISHVLNTARELEPASISLVYGFGGDAVIASVKDDSVQWVFQEHQQGTGHAVRLAMPGVNDESMVLIMYGDVPLIQSATLKTLVDAAKETNTLAVLTIELEQPGQYGRIVRNESGSVASIVEAGDATEEQRAIREINTGFMAAPASLMKKWVDSLNSENQQGEYYLTDIVGLANGDGISPVAVSAGDFWEVEGVNNRVQLAALERIYQRRFADRLMEGGVTLGDPSRLDVRGDLTIGQDSFVDFGVLFEGSNALGCGVSIGPNCVIRNSTINDGTVVQANSVIDSAVIGEKCSIGPFARIRPDTVLAEGAKVGNFVETKKSNVGAYSKINHLSYVGDANIGRNVNIGAGVITCNYDGTSKHITTILDDAFIGSDSQLIAPVTVEKGAFVASGTTLSKNAPADQLTLTRTPQRTIRGWKRPVKKSETE